MTLALGISSRRIDICLLTTSGARKLTPVTLPLGRLMLATSPAATGSVPVAKTIGMVEVAALAASAGSPPPLVNMTETCFLTSSDAIASSRSSWLSAQRYSIVTFWPSTEPASVRLLRNAAIRNAYSSAVVRPRMPITGRVRCALGGCVQRIDAAAAPPRAKMNARRFIASASRASNQKDSTPPHRPLLRCEISTRPMSLVGQTATWLTFHVKSVPPLLPDILRHGSGVTPRKRLAEIGLLLISFQFGQQYMVYISGY